MSMTAKKKQPASTQVTTRLSESLLGRIDAAARKLRRTRADVIRQALDYYLEDIEDLDAGLAALRDPADPTVDWKKARARLLRADA
jgi:RHH-type rel operon transcriptional repressor/antitoxin RelB